MSDLDNIVTEVRTKAIEILTRIGWTPEQIERALSAEKKEEKEEGKWVSKA